MVDVEVLTQPSSIAPSDALELHSALVTLMSGTTAVAAVQAEVAAPLDEGFTRVAELALRA